MTSFSGFQTSSWNLPPSRFSSSHLINQSHASLFLPLSHYISADFGHYLFLACFPKPPSTLPLLSHSCNVSLLVLHNLFSLALILILSFLVSLFLTHLFHGFLPSNFSWSLYSSSIFSIESHASLPSALPAILLRKPSCFPLSSVSFFAPSRFLAGFQIGGLHLE